MIPYKSSLITVVPQTLEKRREVIEAVSALAAQEDEPLRRRRAEIASLRSELTEIALALAELKRACDPRLWSHVIKYSPYQPRVPAGNPDGGQWTSGGGIGSSVEQRGGAHPVSPARPAQYAALDTGSRTDVGEVRPVEQSFSGVQYASTTGVFLLTKNPLIDKASATLLILLTQIVDRVGLTGGILSPSQYGTKIHTEFAAAVKAEGLPGVEVEQTFGPDPDAQYGAKGSIRTDVILRDPIGTIIAIYDVKTGGARLEPWRVRQLRAKTGTTLDTYVFEIHPDRGVMLKYRRYLSKLHTLPRVVGA